MSFAPFPRFRAVLFDLDGTLVRTFIDFPAMREDLRRLAQENGLADALNGIDDILEMAARLGQTGGDALYAEAMHLLILREEAGCANPEAIEGASELLHHLRDERGVKIAIITRNCRAVSEKLLRQMDLSHDLLVAREDTAEFKPHPAPLLLACQALGVAPAESLMVGDLWADIAAGRTAGVAATVGIRWPYLPVDRFARCPPDYEVESLVNASHLIGGGAPRRPLSN